MSIINNSISKENIYKNEIKDISFIIDEIKNLKSDIKELHLELNRKEDDIKNIINEKDNTIKEMNVKLVNQQNLITKNQLEISELKQNINKLKNEMKEQCKKNDQNKSEILTLNNRFKDNNEKYYLLEKELSLKEKDIKEIKSNLSQDIYNKYYELKTIINNNSLTDYKSIKLSAYKNEPQCNLFILFGKTDSGKTTLLNAIFGKEVGEVRKSMMRVTNNYTIYNYRLENGKTIFIMDTPGFSYDSSSSDNYYQKNKEFILSEIKICLKNNNINVDILESGNFKIIFLTNFQCERFDADEQEALLFVNNLFPVRKFWNNLLIIYSHYFSDPDGDDEEEMKRERDRSNITILTKLMEKVKNISDVIDGKDLKFKYLNSIWPIKNERAKNKNLKIKAELDAELDKMIN